MILEVAASLYEAGPSFQKSGFLLVATVQKRAHFARLINYGLQVRNDH